MKQFWKDYWIDAETPDRVFGCFFIALVLFLVVGLPTLYFYGARQEEEEKQACLRSGGQWVIDHYETHIVNGNGDTAPVYGCKK